MNQKRLACKTLVAILLFVGITVSGCGSGLTSANTNASNTTRAPTTDATTSAYATTSADTTPSQPLSKKDSQAFLHDYGNGYIKSTTISVWDPILILPESAIAHPNDASFTLTDFDSKKDIVVPVEYRFTNTTEGFAFDKMPIIFELKQGNGSTSEAYFGDNSYEGNMTYELLLNINGGTSIVYGMSMWCDPALYSPVYSLSTVDSNQTIAIEGFVIIHNFYSPKHPDGNIAILDHAYLHPELGGVEEGITLSGISLESQA